MKRNGIIFIKIIWEKPEARAVITIVVITVIAASLVGIAEFSHNDQFRSFWDTAWWVLVTISTVGYGDKVPVTPIGRIIGVLLMFFGVAILSIVTATISSKFVTRMIKEGKGLQNVTLVNHIILCGWNNQSEQVLQTLEREKRGDTRIVLVNNLPEEEVEAILSRSTMMKMKFVRGDFTREVILQRANAKEADAAIIVPDASSGSGSHSDERTILATLSLKTINPKIKVYAHIIDRENLSHLKKAKADDVIVSDAYTGYLLANFVTSPGIPQFIEHLFSPGSGFQIKRREIPPHMVGKTYDELKSFYAGQFKGILIGLGQISESIDISELLHGDSSYLDAFIMRKFKEAGRGVQADEQIKIILDPAPDYELTRSNFYFSIEG